MEEGKNSLFDTLISRLQVLNHQYDRESDKQDLTKEEREYLNDRFSAELALVIRKWINEGMKESSDFMAKIYLLSQRRFKKVTVSKELLSFLYTCSVLRMFFSASFSYNNSI